LWCASPSTSRRSNTDDHTDPNLAKVPNLRKVGFSQIEQKVNSF
jgi:hypothetical protein